MIILKNKGRLYTFIITAFILFWYYFDCIIHINSKLLTGGSDGLQAYYTALYHLKFDSKFWHFEGMNYPYGESVFFTNGQPLIINLLKFIQPVLDLSNYVVAILNLLVLASILVCANYLYLILKLLKVDTIWAILFAVAFTFLSPQISRVNGHLTLSYFCTIPIFIYYTFIFSADLTYKNSLKLGLISIFFLFIHPYFIVFFCFISLPFFAFILLTKKEKFIPLIKHLCLQLILPVVLFMILQKTHVHDRAQFPLGFIEYKASWEGIFFTPNALYSKFYAAFDLQYPEWEGIAYIGLFGVLSSIFILIYFSWNFIRLKIFKSITPTDKWQVNILLFSSILALLFSFAFPFNLEGYEYYLKFAGPIRQFRGIGRFSWLFFYVINILAVFLLFNFLKTKKRAIQTSVLTASILLVALDVYSNLSANKKEEFSDSLFSEQQFWKEVKNLKTSNFQAIIPLPYFHVGSENVSLDPNSKIKEYVFSISSFTGLPITAVNLSRTSLSQTYENLALISEAYQPLKYLEKCNKKPFLIIVRSEELEPKNISFLKNCTLIKKGKEFDLYKISPQKLIHIQKSLFKNINNNLKFKKWFKNNTYNLSDTTNEVIFHGVNPLNKINKVASHFEFKELNNYKKIGEFSLKSDLEKKYELLFWVENFTEELIPRTYVEISYFDKAKKVIQYDFFSFYEKIQLFDRNAALIQFDMNLPNELDSLKIYMWNKHITDPKTLLKVKNVLIKPINVDIYKKIDKSTLFYNNRNYESK